MTVSPKVFVRRHQRSGTRSLQQKNRERTGRYKRGPKCEVCGRPTGFAYASDRRVDSVFGGGGLVLCSKCGSRLAGLPDAEALAILKIEKYGRRRSDPTCKYLGPEDEAFISEIETMSFEQFEENYATNALKRDRIRLLREYLTDFMPFQLGVEPIEVVVYGSFLTKEWPDDLDVIIHSHEIVDMAVVVPIFGLDIIHLSGHNGYCAYLAFAGISTATRPHETGKRVRIVL